MNEIIEKIKNTNSLEELKLVMIEFVERYQYHFHKTQLPTNDPYNPFPNYSDSEGPENY